MDAQENKGNSPFRMQMIDTIKETANADSMGKLLAFVAHSAKQLGYSEQRLKEMEDAFTEVLTNIIKHAYSSGEGEIEIGYTMDRADRMKFKIIDWGVPFNMLLASDPLLKDEYAEKGLPQPSTRMVKKLTDTVEYQRLENMNYLLITFSQQTRT